MLIRDANTSTFKSERNEYSLEKLKTKFLRNGFPMHFIVKHLMGERVSGKRSITDDKDIDTKSKHFFKLPYRSEPMCREVSKVLRRTGLSKFLQPSWIRGPQLSSYWKPQRTRPSCPKDCQSCHFKNGSLCHLKGVIYKLTCQVCNAIYLGETGRGLGSRFKEHMTNSTSLVFKHFQDTPNHPRPNSSLLSLEVLQRHVTNWYTRNTLETLYINKHRDDKLINVQKTAIIN